MDKEIVVPDFPDLKIPRYYAHVVYRRIQGQIAEIVSQLKAGDGISVTVPLADGSAVEVREFGYQNPNFILVYGTDDTGTRVIAMIPHTVIQVVITVIKEQGDKKRPPIGFLNP